MLILLTVYSHIYITIYVPRKGYIKSVKIIFEKKNGYHKHMKSHKNNFF